MRKLGAVSAEYGDVLSGVHLVQDCRNFAAFSAVLLMDTIKDLAQLLLPNDEPSFHTGETDGLRIVVLKQFRFHKSLNIELYDASLTQAGKIKNPLRSITPQDASLYSNDTNALVFYSGISRFQYPPPISKPNVDIRALKSIVKNPLALRFFYHDPKFSETVSAGSLTEVKVGPVVSKLSLLINKEDHFYVITPQVQVGDALLHPKHAHLMFEYFVLHANYLYLVPDVYMVKLLRYFATRLSMQVSEQQFAAFTEQVLSKLEDKVQVIHTYIKAATKEQVEEAGLSGAMEKIIYLSDLNQYVMINPVMRYGSIEVPIRSNKAIYLPDIRGRMMAMQRDTAAEDNFLALLLRQHPLFSEQLEDGLTYFYLHRDRFLDEDWFQEHFMQWRDAGISVFGFSQLKGNKKNPNKANISVQVQSGLNWFNTKIKVVFGNQAVALKQLQVAARNKSRYVRLDDGTLGILPESWIEKMADFFFTAEIVGADLRIPNYRFETIAQLTEDAGQNEKERSIEGLVTIDIDDKVKEAVEHYRHRLSDISAIERVRIPRGLKTTLRNYQVQGFNWLCFLSKHQFGGILADDMGLGKTVQVIAFMLYRKENNITGTNLVVAPTSVIFNWQAEIKRYGPDLGVHIHHGAERKKSTVVFDKYDVVLTSYGTLLYDIGFMKDYQFGYVFLDESQQIKNIGSQRYDAVRLLQSQNRLAITGTPIENNTFDLFAQMSFVNPGMLGDSRYFREVYSIPIDKFEDTRRAKELQRKVAPFILRRTKDAVAWELPDKTEQVLLCPMGNSQKTVYDAYEQELRDYLEGRIKDETLRVSIHVLRGLTQLRQICNDPRLLKADQVQGSGSSKIETLMEQIDSKSVTNKILVFSQFVSMLELVAAELDKTGIKYVTLTGATTNRKQVVDKFQNDPEVRVFLLSLKAGGMGLNLTAASYVYLVDPWWNPAVEAQAIDRAYRIGQHKNVQAIRLICPDTIEEKIMLLHESKKARLAGLVKSGESIVGNMTMDEWKEILGG
jgi:SNF2 family DNA or RNA helicase